MRAELDRFTQESIKILNEKKEETELLRKELIDFLTDEIIPKISKDKIIIQDRIKDDNSLKEKIIRKNYHNKYSNNAVEFIEQLPDLVGIRLVCFLNGEEEIISNKFSSIFHEVDIKNEGYKRISRNKDGIEQSLSILIKSEPDIQKNNNLIYKYSCKWCSNSKTTNVEIQIKSLVHMFWGEIEHLLLYKNYNYLLDSSFYSEIMNSTYSLLKDIDGQLASLQKHLNTKDPDKQIIDIKETLAKILHANLQTKIEYYFQSKIDLRVLYDALVHILLYNYKSVDKLFSKSAEIISNLSKIDFKEENMNIRDTSFPSTSILGQGLGVDKICKIIDESILNNNIFWVLFMKIYQDINGKTYTESLKEFAIQLLNSYSIKYAESIQANEEVSKFISTIIIEGICDSFKNNISLEFISSETVIITQINEFIQEFLEFLSKLSPREANNDIRQFLSTLLSIRIQSALNTILNIELVTELIKYYQKSNVMFENYLLDTDSLNEALKLVPLDSVKVAKIIESSGLSDAN